jgi:hypothetical protein
MLEGSTLGTLVELMVRAEILAGSDGRLIPSRFEPDVDHRDLIVADVGGYGAEGRQKSVWIAEPRLAGGSERQIGQVHAACPVFP